MDISNFKDVEVKKEAGLKTIFNGKQFRRTIIFMLIGAIAGFAYFYYTEGQHLEVLASQDIFKSAALGALFGIFISNSPCARGAC